MGHWGTLMKNEIDPEFENDVANFYQSLGVNQGPGDIQYRLILKVLEKNKDKSTEFSDIRYYTDEFAERGSIGSKMKTVFLRNELAVKIKHGGYKITDKGLVASNMLKLSTIFYKEVTKLSNIIERMP